MSRVFIYWSPFRTFYDGVCVAAEFSCIKIFDQSKYSLFPYRALFLGSGAQAVLNAQKGNPGGAHLHVWLRSIQKLPFLSDLLGMDSLSSYEYHIVRLNL